MNLKDIKQFLDEYLSLSPETTEKLILTLVIFILLSGIKLLINIIIKRRVVDVKSSYRLRRAVLYTYTILLVVLIGPIWIRGITSLGKSWIYLLMY